MDWRIVIGLLALTGCSNSFSKVIEVAGEVPDWYDARRAEIRGEGYPRLTDVPERTSAGFFRTRTTELSEASAETRAAFLSDPRAESPSRGSEDIRALAARLKQQIPADLDVPEEPFLTDEEIEAIERMFDPYRP